MELWDAYTRDLQRIEGTVLVRGEPMPEGVYHLVADVLVGHVDGTWLVMRRARCKHNGGQWEATAGGSALQGESPRQCAARELYEETGVTALDMVETGRSINDERHTVYVEYLCRTACDKDSVRLQAGETEAYRWVATDELRTMRDDGTLTRRSNELVAKVVEGWC